MPGFGVLIFTACLAVIFICFLASIVKFIRKNSLKRRILAFIEICLPVLFVLLFFVQIRYKFDFWGRVDPYSRGYSDRIKSQIDIMKYDIDMNQRISGSAIDIGAVEAQ